MTTRITRSGTSSTNDVPFAGRRPHLERPIHARSKLLEQREPDVAFRTARVAVLLGEPGAVVDRPRAAPGRSPCDLHRNVGGRRRGARRSGPPRRPRGRRAAPSPRSGRARRRRRGTSRSPAPGAARRGRRARPRARRLGGSAGGSRRAASGCVACCRASRTAASRSIERSRRRHLRVGAPAAALSEYEMPARS